ncbi:hypothetical protein GCK72_019669 [Caenorhabditis remanei]|uniref:Zinc metalloproteinase n=1 Tax=Caenorhabditis remanei TaxID=31234 RepID=A0A6A5GEM4_CAERE|nr:hypothetical protein GCK72_019669 [Caenorhabditis remanei]KAF1753113.1 hypothetical protein GCK72_019669 [Caenorhabditis remanei]
MKYISARTCIKFKEDITATDRVLFIFRGYCSSTVGKSLGGGVQEVTMSNGCDSTGQAVHEQLHALGITHTQSRYDRDDYLIVKPELFNSADEVNFMKYTDTQTYNNIPYEYGSAMHYTAQTVSEPKQTIYRETMGNRLVTFYDMRSLHESYNCSCPVELNCKNGGVTNPANCSECFCPAGFGGKLCDDVPRGFSKKLVASSNWSDFEITFGFPWLFESEYKRLTLFIEAPKNKTIQVQVTNIEGYTFSSSCIWNGYEVKHMGDPRIMNPLYCCTTQPLWNTTYTSKINPSPVILYNRNGQQKFAMRYRYIDGNVADLPKRNNTYDSFEYPI